MTYDIEAFLFTRHLTNPFHVMLFCILSTKLIPVTSTLIKTYTGRTIYKCVVFIVKQSIGGRNKPFIKIIPICLTAFTRPKIPTNVIFRNKFALKSSIIMTINIDH